MKFYNEGKLFFSFIFMLSNYDFFEILDGIVIFIYYID